MDTDMDESFGFDEAASSSLMGEMSDEFLMSDDDDQMSGVDYLSSVELVESPCYFQSDDEDIEDSMDETDDELFVQYSSGSEEEEKDAPSQSAKIKKLHSQEPLYPGARLTHHDFFHLVAKTIETNQMTNKSATDMLKILDLVLPEGFNCVDSLNLITKAVFNEQKIARKPCCSHCKKELESEKSVCRSEICQKKRKPAIAQCELASIFMKVQALSREENFRKANEVLLMRSNVSRPPLVTDAAKNENQIDVAAHTSKNTMEWQNAAQNKPPGEHTVVSDSDEDQIEPFSSFSGMEPEKCSTPLMPSANSLPSASIGRKDMEPAKVRGMVRWKVKGRDQAARFVDLSKYILFYAQMKMHDVHLKYIQNKKAIEAEEEGKWKMSSAEATSKSTGKNPKKPKNSLRKPMVVGFNYCITEEFGTEKLLTLSYNPSNKNYKYIPDKIPLTDKEKDLVAAYTGYLSKYLKQKIAIGELFHLYTFDTDSKMFSTLCNGKRSARALSIKLAQKKEEQQGQQVSAGE